MRHFAGFGTHFHRHQLVTLVFGRVAFVRDERLQVFVEYLALLVGQTLEAGKRGIERLLAVEHDAEFSRAWS